MKKGNKAQDFDSATGAEDSVTISALDFPQICRFCLSREKIVPLLGLSLEDTEVISVLKLCLSIEVHYISMSAVDILPKLHLIYRLILKLTTSLTIFV